MMNSRYSQDYRPARPSRGWFHHDQDTLTGREYIPSNERRNSSVVEDYRSRKSPPFSRYARDRSPRSNREQSRSFNRDFLKGRKYETENYDYQGRHNNYDSRYSSSHRTGRSKSREQDRWNDRGDARDRRAVRCRDDIQQTEGREKRRMEVDRLDDYERSHSRDRNERSVRDFYREEDQGRSLSNEPQNPPCSTVIVQGLTTQANETMIENALKQDGVRARTVSIIRDRNGDSKRYAFVEFDDVFEAEAWLKISKRIILVGGQTAYLNYSRSKKSEQLVFGDWYCNECQVLNFGSRRKFGKMSTCFQCGAQKKEVEQLSYDEKQQSDAKKEKSEPCNVLMVRGMDFATTEDTIRSQISKLTSHAIYDVRLIRDKVTDMSRGFAFVELGTIEHASELLERIETSDPAVEIEGRKISVGFARHGYNAPLNGKKSKSLSEKADKQAFADNAFAQAGAANAAVTPQYSQSATDNLHPLAGTSVPQTTASNKTQQPQQHADMYSYYQQPANHSSYTFDPTTGFYYDSSTGLYYDANSGYYYNGTTGQYLFWNGTRYQAVNQDGTPVPQNQTATPNKSTEAEQKDILLKPDDKSKVNLHGQKPKDARKIAKDMERWAKKMNNANEARKHAVKQAQEELKMLEQKEEELRKKIKEEKSIVNTLDSTVKNKDGIKSLFVPDNDDEVAILKLESALQTSKNVKPLKSVSLVAEIQEDDDDVTDEMKFVDTVKIACLLCKRQFPSNDVLTKHLQMSQLHKQNLEAYRKTQKN